MIEIIRTNSDDPNFRMLTSLLDQELRENYGALQNNYDQYNQIESMKPVIIYLKDNLPVGCGCFRIFRKDTIEIKRMFVKSDFRGRGYSGIILQELEIWAKEQNYQYATLETGIKQEVAIQLYTKKGYRIIENYGPYKGNPNSICMLKELSK